ncbi:hypothetical protein MVEG_01090 [Podila verticillata NRRL 6337]|nr:hypothetical protein MVEG_01090 [Podila verticillata NRRL 6337]
MTTPQDEEMADAIDPAGKDSLQKYRQDIKARNLLQSFVTSYASQPSTGNNPETTRWGSRPRLQEEDARTTIAPSSTLFNKTWNLYKTTPFFKFSLQHCERYQSELQAHIGANARNFTTASNGGDLYFPKQIDGDGHNIVETLDDLGDVKKIEFQVLDLDETQRDADATPRKLESVLITVTVRPKGKTKELPYYCVILLESLSAEDTRQNADFTYYSTILMKAPVVIGQVITQWLERKFDCRVCRLTFQKSDLRKVVNDSIEQLYGPDQDEFRGDKANRPIELTYALPAELSGLKTISVTIPAAEARQLLASRKAGSQAGILEGIEDHCSDSMKIDFGRLDLVRAGCAVWYIACEGKLKIFPTILKANYLRTFLQALENPAG